MAFGGSAPPIVFLHVGWSREYRGRADDRPQGKFGYIREGNKYLGEALNFKSFGRKLYGYTPFHSKIDLKKLGAVSGSDYANNVLVIWTATNPDGSGRYIVGWYKDARVYAQLVETRPDRQRPHVLVEAASVDGHLVPLDDRTFFIPSMQKGWPGVSSVYYASENLREDQINLVLSYTDGLRSRGFYDGPKPRPQAQRSSPYESDPEQRAKVEKAAVSFVVRHYEGLSWKVESVEKKNLGWDLEATFGARILLIEVKGRSGRGSVELSPNEYQEMRRRENLMNYRLAIVLNATSSLELSIFSYNPAIARWVSDAGQLLQLTERVAAIATF